MCDWLTESGHKSCRSIWDISTLKKNKYQEGWNNPGIREEQPVISGTVTRSTWAPHLDPAKLISAPNELFAINISSTPRTSKHPTECTLITILDHLDIWRTRGVTKQTDTSRTHIQSLPICADARDRRLFLTSSWSQACCVVSIVNWPVTRWTLDQI